MLSVIIPTYNRERVLLDTIDYLLGLDLAPDEIVIVDQTPQHLAETQQALDALVVNNAIRVIRSETPSIPKAMNRGLVEARGDLVLFLDDDIAPEPSLIAAHLAAHTAHSGRLVVGRVIQPWQEGVDFSKDTTFHFASLRPAIVTEFLGGNFSLDRRMAISLGGFDENFVKAAYNFEAEYAFRWRNSGREIFYEPSACLHHLKVSDGGTRSFGEHLTVIGPAHSVGAYYCILRTWSGSKSLGAWLSRPLRSIATRFHLRHPWRIPPTLISEVAGMALALRLAARGPRYIVPAQKRSDHDV